MANPLDIPSEFLEQYAAALRMEPDSRTADLEDGIAVRTADPLWYLARQWQVGEFDGEDAGSPIDVNLIYKTQSIESNRIRNVKGVIISDDDLHHTGSSLLEKIVEQEWTQIDWKISAQIGQEFEKQIYILIPNKDLAAQYVERLRTAFPFKIQDKEQELAADEATRRFISFMEGRVVNGRLILEGLTYSEGLLSMSSSVLQEILPDDKLQLIGSHLIKWCEALNIRKVPERSKAWRNERLDYHFSLDSGENSSDNDKILIAPEYRSGSLDWYTFDALPEVHTSEKWLEHTSINLLPTPINIMGISRRWWEFEDAKIDIGHIEVGREDIARAILLQYALIYGDDWYSFPLPVPISHLIKIYSLQVNNVFGQTETIEPANRFARDPLQQWTIFTMSRADRSPSSIDTERPVLYIPPVLSFRQESDPLEEARFIRDEWSNMVWCIEHTILNGLGKPVDGYKAQLERFEYGKADRIMQLKEEIGTLRAELSAQEPTSSEYSKKQSQLDMRLRELKELDPESIYEESSFPKYRLATCVPENWIPFMPFNGRVFKDEKSIRLRRAQMLRNKYFEKPEPIKAMTRLLEISEDPLLWLEEDVIPRSGLRICLTSQRTRWTDGQTFVWKGRKILTSSGEGRSGLIFDKILNL